MRRRRGVEVWCWVVVLLLGFAWGRAHGNAILISTNDTYAKIEAANPGDEVMIAPGTYAFRVYLSKKATPTNRIWIHAQFPTNPPVWDFGSTLVENAPGSYGAGDRGRGGWQFSGAHNYTISGIVFRHARTGSFNSAGIRYYNGTTNLVIRDCLFDQNDNGLTGGTQNSQATVEFCEFKGNGNLSAGAPTHNLYIYGGYLAMRYCYVHDSAQAQNFHIRCRESTLEYNWFARAASYEGDLMTDDDWSGAGPFLQTMILRGNVFIQNSLPGNHSQVVAIYNDTGLANLTLSVRALYNTFIGVNTNAAFVHVSNADATAMTAEISDNILYGTRTAVLIENAGAGTVVGSNNWLMTNANAGPLTASIRSATPGFRNPAQADYTLTNGSVCVGAASAAVFGMPGREYFQNETINRRWRVRAAAHDLGAFESTTDSNSVGPYDLTPRPSLSIGLNGGSPPTLAWPLFAQDSQLEQTDLSNPVTWSQAQPGYLTSAVGIFLATPTNSARQFYRLRQ